jgi:CheY-like chemotaxis protein
MLHFSVRDTGIGIPAHLQEMIFEPFSQADASTTRKYGGTGLGLAIAGRLIALMEGRIWLDSAEGEGSTFHFTASFEAAPERNTAHEVPADLTGQAILVVDDNRTNRRILEETLTLWGVEADTAASGREALERVSARRRVGRPFGAVLLDLAMPEMDGRAVAAEIQRSDPSPPLLVLLSSADGAALRETSPEAEFGAILTKPINRGLLLNTLRQLLGRKEPSVSESGDDSQQIPPLRSALRVLVAEDNPVNQRVAVRMLEKRGYQVHLAANGREALAALDRHAFDVVLMDVQMPELNGFQATAAIREREQDCQRRLPVIAMTAHAMKGDQERCLAAGMDGYLSKPIRAADLYETIERLYHTMNQPSKSDASACAVAACLDLDALKAQYGDDPDLLEEVLDIFEADSLKLMERIRTALTDDALEAVSRAAHTLKGAISNIFAPPAHAAAFAVEQTSRSGDPGATAAAFGELQRAMEHLPAALAALRVDVATWEPSI